VRGRRRLTNKEALLGLEFLEDVRIGREVELTSSGLVRELAEFFMGKIPDTAEKVSRVGDIPSHPDWCETLAVALIGTIVGKNRFIRNKFGEVYANIFSVMVGGSGISFKTVPLTIVRSLLDRVSIVINEDVCQKNGMTMEEFQTVLQESKRASNRMKGTNAWKQQKWDLDRVEGKFVDLRTLEKFTSEMLVTWLIKNPQGMIVGDEWTKMFKGARTKDYLKDNMEDLSRLWDVQVEKVGTQTRGVEYPKDAYVAFVSATTYYLLTLMDEEFFMQGTGNRILWIVDEEMLYMDVEENVETMQFFWTVDNMVLYDRAMDSFTQQLVNVLHLPDGLVNVSFGASVMLDRYRLHMHNRAVDKHKHDLLNIDANYIIRLAQNAMKLSLVHCVGRYAQDPRGTVRETMEVSIEDTKWAIMKVERHYYYYNRLWAIASRVRKGTTKEYKDDIGRVLYLVDRQCDSGERLTATALRQNTGWLRDDCTKILDTMVANNMIEARVYVDGTGRKRGFYVRSEWAEDEDRKWSVGRNGRYEGKLLPNP